MLRQTIVRRTALFLAVCVMPETQAWAAVGDLPELVSKPYLELAEIAPTLSFDNSELKDFRKDLDRERKAEEKRLKAEQKDLERKLKDLRDQLKSLNRESSEDSPQMAERRQAVHCQIIDLEKQIREKRIEISNGMPNSFDNKLAKVQLIEKWPAIKSEITAAIAAGRARQRQYGDVEDIGFRDSFEDQEKDIKLGEDALKEMKLYSLMPPELDAPAVKARIQQMADRIAMNSDVKVPVKLTLLRSEEINAFALPGGLLFVNTGLLLKATDESEVAGVIAHELAHVSARHGARLMRRANIANLMYQMAQIAVAIGTGGFGTIGTYYLMQAGFLGLGMVLNLNLLGVSREFEAEADQLGTQYAWKAGYDPRGFITFFDKMASEKGYVTSASFFRTHPAFYERIVSTLSEVTYLPHRDDLLVDTSGFEDMQNQITEAVKNAPPDPKAPTLRREPECPDPAAPRSKQSRITDTKAPAFCFVCPAGA